MPTIQVVKPFTLQLDPHTSEIPDPMDREGRRMTVVTHPSEMQRFEIGIYDVEDRIANHWYVKAHLKGYVEPARGPGTAEVAIAQMLQRPQADAKDGTIDPAYPRPPDAMAPQPARLPPNVIMAAPVNE